MKRIYQYVICAAVAILAAGCIDHDPVAVELPSEDVAFVYQDIDAKYPLDYYVDSDVKFYSISYLKGTAIWNFGDGTAEVVGDTVIHVFEKAGSYNVRLTITTSDGRKETQQQPILISDIKPLMTINPFSTDVCEVLTTDVSFMVELPNPKARSEEYHWIFPEGTTNENGEEMKTFDGKDPGKIRFSNVGSQAIQLVATLGGRVLETAKINVQVGYNEAVPTLYYSTYGGNIMALKLVENAPEGMKIAPYDMAISSGQHPFNLLFKDSSLYVLDAGKQYYYVNDEDGVLGDGKISVMSKDGKIVEMMITNAGQAAFDDPFYGTIDGDFLYYANRNTGIVRVALKERNAVYDPTAFPYYVQHTTLGYYNNGWSYGSIGGCIGKVDGVWHWCKIYNGTGIFRFKDSDILPSVISQGDETNVPKDGIALSGMFPRAFAYDKTNDRFFFTIFDIGYGGLYCCTKEQLNAIGSSKAALAPYKVLTVDGKGLEPNTSGSPAAIEGTGSEVVGICQLALDEKTGCVYFGYRNTQNDASCAPTGLYRYNPANGMAECVVEGPIIYGLAINPNEAKLF